MHVVVLLLSQCLLFERCVAGCRVFANKGDMWRLLNSLSDVVDGRTWPENQEPQVGSEVGPLGYCLSILLFSLYDVATA